MFNDLRDGLLEQAATAVSARVSQKGELTAPEIIHVASIQESTEWIEKKNSTNVQTTSIPSPGSKDWNEYATAHSSMIRFLEQVIPMLSGGSNIDPSLFDSNVTFFSVDGSLLMNGNTTVSNFYQSLALARRGTGGSWTLNRCSLLDWRNRIISVDYEASNNIPPWTIQGRDIYTLISSDGEERPIVQRIQQEKFSASNPDGTLTLDNKWLMNNLVGAVERGRLSSGTQDILSELFAQKASVTALSKRRPKLSRSVAANVYYIMSDLHERVETLLNDTSNRLPPAAEFMVEEVELHGYLGETLIRGSNSYNRFFGTLEAALYQSISQKRLVVEKRIPPRVELTPKGDIRLSLTMHFRLPPPILSDSPVMSGVPLQFELVSDYKIDPDTGFVNQHRLIATRVNGQLTPGDLLSRWIQKLLNFEDNIEFIDGGNEDVLKSFSDALSWFRTLASK